MHSTDKSKTQKPQKPKASKRPQKHPPTQPLEKVQKKIKRISESLKHRERDLTPTPKSNATPTPTPKPKRKHNYPQRHRSPSCIQVSTYINQQQFIILYRAAEKLDCTHAQFLREALEEKLRRLYPNYPNLQIAPEASGSIVIDSLHLHPDQTPGKLRIEATLAAQGLGTVEQVRKKLARLQGEPIAPSELTQLSEEQLVRAVFHKRMGRPMSEIEWSEYRLAPDVPPLPPPAH